MKPNMTSIYALDVDGEEPWREYFRDKIENAHKEGDRADRFEQYLARFQGADVSVYVSDLISDGSAPPKWQTGRERLAPRDSEMNGGFRSHRDLDQFLSAPGPDNCKFRLITVDATSTEVIQILGHKYNMAPEFFENRAYSGRKSHMSRLWSSERPDGTGKLRNHSYTVLEVIDYVWLGKAQPAHLQLADRSQCAFEFETPYQEGDYPWFHPALLWESALTMASMPRKVSFYLIFGEPGTPTTCILFLETIARAKAGTSRPHTLHLSSREGTTIIWQQKPVIIRGMYLTYFLFDCFGSLEPQPWDSQAYHSALGKKDNNRMLATDGRWALVAFYRALLALGEFNLVGWSQRLDQLGDEAMKDSNRQLARALHSHLDDIYFHQEKFLLLFKVGRVIASQRDEAIFVDLQESSTTLQELTQHAEHSLQRYDRFEKKIVNTIQMIFNSATIDEAHSSLVQNARIGFLTLLATLFIPLSFIASLFSMNVRELQEPSTLPGIAVYFESAIPVTLGVFITAALVRFITREMKSRAGRRAEKMRSFFIRRPDEKVLAWKETEGGILA